VQKKSVKVEQAKSNKPPETVYEHVVEDNFFDFLNPDEIETLPEALANQLPTVAFTLERKINTGNYENMVVRVSLYTPFVPTKKNLEYACEDSTSILEDLLLEGIDKMVSLHKSGQLG